jgi:hypothetical protein
MHAPELLALGALAFAVGAATGRKGLALGISAGVAVFAYLASGFFPQVEGLEWGLEWTREVSLWHWYLGGEPPRTASRPATRCSCSRGPLDWWPPAPGSSTTATSPSELGVSEHDAVSLVPGAHSLDDRAGGRALPTT